MFSINEVTSQLVVSQSYDLSQRGSYLSAELIGTIYDASSIPVFTRSIEYFVFVNPCQITQFYSDPSDLGYITYTLGQPGFSFGAYSFV